MVQWLRLHLPVQGWGWGVRCLSGSQDPECPLVRPPQKNCRTIRGRNAEEEKKQEEGRVQGGRCGWLVTQSCLTLLQPYGL